MSIAIDKDLRAATKIFLACAMLLLIMASLNIATWPSAEIAAIFESPSAPEIIARLSANGFSFVIIFWASRPTLTEKMVVTSSCIALTLAAFYYGSPDLKSDWTNSLTSITTLLSTTMMIPCLAALIIRISIQHYALKNSIFEHRLKWLVILVFLFLLIPTSALSLTKSLHPFTLDLMAAKFDAAANIDISHQVMAAIDAIPYLKQAVWMAYGMTPVAFLAVAILQLYGRSKTVPTAMLLWVMLTLAGTVAYHLFPIAGPRYIFGADQFPSALESADQLPIAFAQVGADFPRNGMPSLHFGWMLAATILWFRSNTQVYSKAIYLVMTTLVALATIYTGEHYTVDLIVAAPFVMSSISLATTEPSFPQSRRWACIILGFSTWLIWILALRFAINVFVIYPESTWVLIIFTAAVVIFQWRMQQPTIENFTAPAINPAENDCDEAVRLNRKAGLMFFVSGAAALIYQVLFAKELALIFGSTSTATLTVLATFLGGMAIGSLVGGVIVPRVKTPIRLYALLELAIGALCVATPTLFGAVQFLYVGLAAGIAPEAPILFVLRIALGAAVLLLPTILMGMTLPLLTKALNPAEENTGHSVAWLYACNTGGAAAGALFASYTIIPTLGVKSTTLIAALLNFLVALGAIELGKSIIANAVKHQTVKPANYIVEARSRRILFGAWFALGAGGILSLGMEVIYVHMLSIVAGNSVYAFGLMLATFLTGLALGGEAGRRLIRRPSTSIGACLALTQVTLAVALTLGTQAWDAIPAYFGSFANYPAVNGFRAHEAVRGLVCAAVMMPPTILIGLSYTLAMQLATSCGSGSRMRLVGLSAAVNTVGNIVGVFIFGFVLLPKLGGLQASRAAVMIALLIALIVLITVTRRLWSVRLIAALAAAIALSIGVPTTLDYRALGSGASVYFVAQDWGDIIDHAESVDGGLTMVARRTTAEGDINTLLTNGKFQGNDATQGEVKAQIGFAAMSLLHQPSRGNALVIGYGTGMTSRVLHDAGFRHLDIAELSRDVIRLADAHFGHINQRVSRLPGVTTHITDGRNMLLLSRQSYDIISIEITSIWFAGAASLYNQEFYELAKRRMAPGGVLQQWVQLHHMSQADLLTIIGTLRAEFKYVTMYVVGGQGVLIATDDKQHTEVDTGTATALDIAPGLQEIRNLAGRTFASMAADQALSAGQTDELLDKVGVDRSLWVSTDDNLRLEYSTPKANVLNPDLSVVNNLKLLESARAAYAVNQSKAASQGASR